MKMYKEHKYQNFFKLLKKIEFLKMVKLKQTYFMTLLKKKLGYRLKIISAEIITGTHQTNTCSKSRIETLERVKYVSS